MRRILNLNQPGLILVKIIVLFAVIIPAVLYCISLLLTEEQINRVLFSVMRVSFALGMVLFVALLALIIAEQIQDRFIDLQYQKNRDRKLSVGDGSYECQYCGNRKVKEPDTVCSLCGRELK